MEQENKRVSNILMSKDWIYLSIIFLLLFVLSSMNNNFIIPSIGLWFAMLFYSLRTNGKRREEIERHIESLTFNMDSVTKDTLLNFPLPMLTLELNGMIVWHNLLFQNIIGEKDLVEKYIYEFAEELKPENLIKNNKILTQEVKIKDRVYKVLGNLVRTSEKNSKEHYTLSLYFIDITDYSMLLKKHFEEEPDIGVIIIDNYDELMTSIDESGRSQLLAEIDKVVKQWFAFSNGVVRKYERDKYIMFFESRYLAEMKDRKFDILDTAKEIDIGNKLQVTLSIGIASHMQDFATGMKEALGSIELAQGRGGDQAVINENGEYNFFGGRSKEIEKRTRVKARVMANALEKLIEQCENVLIMGHANPDADAFGAALGIYRVAQCLNRPANIVLGDEYANVREIVDKVESSGQYEGVFIKEHEALEIAKQETLLIVVDTHRASFTECPDLLDKTSKIVVIDHHRKVTDFISEAFLTYHEIYASSACELVTELLQYMDKKVSIRQLEAEALYAGIILDTKNFTFKTGIRTFEAAAFLKKYGVDTIAVKQLFQNDLETYIDKAEIVKNAEIYNDEIAISACDKELLNTSIIVAQSADELLNIKGIKASFVLSPNDNKIVISGRSLGDINVQVILEKLGGGGSMTIAGAQMPNVTIEEATNRLKQAIDSYKDSSSKN